MFLQVSTFQYGGIYRCVSYSFELKCDYEQPYAITCWITVILGGCFCLLVCCTCLLALIYTPCTMMMSHTLASMAWACLLWVFVVALTPITKAAQPHSDAFRSPAVANSQLWAIMANFVSGVWEAGFSSCRSLPAGIHWQQQPAMIIT